MSRGLKNLQNNKINNLEAPLIHLFNQPAIIIHTAINEPAGVATKRFVLKTRHIKLAW